MLSVRTRACCVASLLLTAYSPFDADSAPSEPESKISVHGKVFFKDGQPWIAKGVVVEGFNAPRSVRKSAAKATAYYGADELAAAKRVFGANTIHFKISEPGLDPTSPIFDSEYIVELQEAVALARRSGFVVILSMDSQAENGVPNMPCMPTPGTLRAWRSVASWIRSDEGIMLEVFNEPCKPDNPANEAEWAGEMQTLVDGLRGVKATNVILLNGLTYGRSVGGLFAKVHDSLADRLALSVHPYLMNGFTTEEDWKRYFGITAQKYPMIATEFNATPSNGCVGPDTPTIALHLIRYLQKLHVGLIAWAIDSSFGRLVADHELYEPLGYDSFQDCRDSSLSGAGKLLARFPNS